MDTNKNKKILLGVNKIAIQPNEDNVITMEILFVTVENDIMPYVEFLKEFNEFMVDKGYFIDTSYQNKN